MNWSSIPHLPSRDQAQRPANEKEGDAHTCTHETLCRLSVSLREAMLSVTLSDPACLPSVPQGFPAQGGPGRLPEAEKALCRSPRQRVDKPRRSVVGHRGGLLSAPAALLSLSRRRCQERSLPFFHLPLLTFCPAALYRLPLSTSVCFPRTICRVGQCRAHVRTLSTIDN